MAEPVYIACSTACTVTVQHEIVLPLLNLTAAEGALIAGAVLAVWGVAWGFRVVIQTLKHTDGNSETLNKD